MKTKAVYASLKMSPKYFNDPTCRYTPTTFQITNPMRIYVNAENINTVFYAYFVHVTPSRLPPTAINTVTTYSRHIKSAT